MGSVNISEDLKNVWLNYCVATELLNHVINNQNNSVITYGELSKLLEEKHQLVYKPRGLGAPLTVISRTCVENGLPPISSIVVLKRDEGNVGLPAKEFYDKMIG